MRRNDPRFLWIGMAGWAAVMSVGPAWTAKGTAAAEAPTSTGPEALPDAAEADVLWPISAGDPTEDDTMLREEEGGNGERTTMSSFSAPVVPLAEWKPLAISAPAASVAFIVPAVRSTLALSLPPSSAPPDQPAAVPSVDVPEHPVPFAAPSLSTASFPGPAPVVPPVSVPSPPSLSLSPLPNAKALTGAWPSTAPVPDRLAATATPSPFVPPAPPPFVPRSSTPLSTSSSLTDTASLSPLAAPVAGSSVRFFSATNGGTAFAPDFQAFDAASSTGGMSKAALHDLFSCSGLLEDAESRASAFSTLHAIPAPSAKAGITLMERVMRHERRHGAMDAETAEHGLALCGERLTATRNVAAFETWAERAWGYWRHARPEKNATAFGDWLAERKTIPLSDAARVLLLARLAQAGDDYVLCRDLLLPHVDDLAYAPRRAELLLMLGMALTQLDDPASRVPLERVVKEHPDAAQVARALFLLAWTDLMEGRETEARTGLRRLLAEHPGDALAKRAREMLEGLKPPAPVEKTPPTDTPAPVPVDDDIF